MPESRNSVLYGVVGGYEADWAGERSPFQKISRISCHKTLIYLLGDVLAFKCAFDLQITNKCYDEWDLWYAAGSGNRSWIRYGFWGMGRKWRCIC